MEHEDRSTYLGSHSPAAILGKHPQLGKVGEDDDSIDDEDEREDEHA